MPRSRQRRRLVDRSDKWLTVSRAPIRGKDCQSRSTGIGRACHLSEIPPHRRLQPSSFPHDTSRKCMIPRPCVVHGHPTASFGCIRKNGGMVVADGGMFEIQRDRRSPKKHSPVSSSAGPADPPSMELVDPRPTEWIGIRRRVWSRWDAPPRTDFAACRSLPETIQSASNCLRPKSC